jgi:hypothetical protein
LRLNLLNMVDVLERGLGDKDHAAEIHQHHHPFYISLKSHPTHSDERIPH